MLLSNICDIIEEKGWYGMPKIDNMLKTMQKQGISDEIISQFKRPKTKTPKPEDIVAFVEQMDDMLSKEQCLSIMSEQGCYKTDRVSEKFRIFGELHKDKTLAERIALLPELDSPHRVPCFINNDGTITLKFGSENEGFGCLCSTVKKLKSPIIPLTYCGCCGGHVKYTHEFALGVTLRLKEIVSSMATSDGEKPCEFIFEIDYS